MAKRNLRIYQIKINEKFCFRNIPKINIDHVVHGMQRFPLQSHISLPIYSMFSHYVTSAYKNNSKIEPSAFFSNFYIAKGKT